MTSKFESIQKLLPKTFKGPYPLDKEILRNLVPAKPGVYIWYSKLNGRLVGYVGQSTNLLSRLNHWASEVDEAYVFIRGIDQRKLNKFERKWINLAGDLNKV